MSAYCVPGTLHHEGGWCAEGGRWRKEGISAASQLGFPRSALCCITMVVYVLCHKYELWALKANSFVWAFDFKTNRKVCLSFLLPGTLPWVPRLRRDYSEVVYLTFSFKNTQMRVNDRCKFKHTKRANLVKRMLSSWFLVQILFSRCNNFSVFWVYFYSLYIIYMLQAFISLLTCG